MIIDYIVNVLAFIGFFSLILIILPTLWEMAKEIWRTS